MKVLHIVFIIILVVQTLCTEHATETDQEENVVEEEYLIENAFFSDLDSGLELDRFNGVNYHDALSRNPAVINSTKLIIEHHGYPYEEHEVTTPDGYLLTIYRIPGSQKYPEKTGKSVVFLQHGLLSCSSDFVVGGPNQALGFILADAGYDVWLGNARGNTYSRKHLYLSPNKKEFWQFSWHEIGQIDLPAMINFALNKTGESKLHYIGHSQGTTTFFVMGALDVKGTMMSKIKSMQALAPAVFMTHMKSPFIRAMAPFIKTTKKIMNMLGIHEFFPSSKMMQKSGQILCRDESLFQEICSNLIFLLCGYNSEQLNRTILPAILVNTPAGSAVNQIVHFIQGIKTKNKFQMFDHGKSKNKKIYGTKVPPEYDLSNVKAPVALHYSDNDWMSAVKDVENLATKLPNLIGKFRVSHKKWNHLDFIWAIDSKFYLYDRVINLLKRFDD